MTSALILKNNNFIELTNDELMFVDGGGVWQALVGAAGAIAIGAAPLVGVLAGIGGSVVGTPVIGVAAGISASAAMVSSGAYMLDYGTKK
ncbi:hypothetical protein BSK49_07585 [Paenibacillus odorifer]|jgi:hypothetical protein|uniref:Bacteriocin n=1 Tax=Paenibacillus odorifer TaxID=189426 RepID=A0ABX3GHG4_9BACL|nr:hypothetical protein [Paenibacillus odorifer]OMD20596.1 hypothetical protein BSO21_24335 [Paenibacillus odorifer]OMD91184.1 hypothetical protein BSK49_07585 [Paenibacillus odorifer]